MPGLVVEICAEGIASALAAAQGGADRIELCEHLSVGGVSPSAGTISVAVQQRRPPLHVLIRPRGGDFVYDAAEEQSMRHNIRAARALGANGVVLGVLRGDRTIDVERTRSLIAEARPLRVTFHRAFDAVPDPIEALETLIDLGVSRLLTSGGASEAREGLDLLAKLVDRAADRITIMAGGRVTQDDLPALADAGLREVHVGSAVRRGERTDPLIVRQFVEAARAAGGDLRGRGD